MVGIRLLILDHILNYRSIVKYILQKYPMRSSVIRSYIGDRLLKANKLIKHAFKNTRNSINIPLSRAVEKKVHVI